MHTSHILLHVYWFDVHLIFWSLLVNDQGNELYGIVISFYNEYKDLDDELTSIQLAEDKWFKKVPTPSFWASQLDAASGSDPPQSQSGLNNRHACRAGFDEIDPACP